MNTVFPWRTLERLSSAYFLHFNCLDADEILQIQSMQGVSSATLFRPARGVHFLFLVFRQKTKVPAFTETRHSLTVLSRQPSGLHRPQWRSSCSVPASSIYNVVQRDAAVLAGGASIGSGSHLRVMVLGLPKVREGDGGSWAGCRRREEEKADVWNPPLGRSAGHAILYCATRAQG
jgi:hypothetical protein